MPDDDGVIDIDLTGEQEDMAFPETSEAGVMQVALSGLAGGFAAAAQRRTDRADQLGGDSQAMWSIAMTTPTFSNAQAMRVANEAGSGRTRAETNAPAATSAGQ